jgi:hypothetical protein
MSRNFLSATMIIPTLFYLGLAGCGGQSSGPSGSTAGVETGAPPSAEAEHTHASEGPHGGTLIELGNGAYHAELVHDDAAETVTVHILDSSAQSGVAIEAAEITINLKRGGRGKQFKVAAAPDPSDSTGKSSRFVSSDPELADDLDQEGAGARLVISIDGKQYRGDIDHHHGHDEHDHEHANE